MSFDSESDESRSMDEEWSEESSTMECPHCGESIYEDAEQCPYCSDYIVAGSHSSLSPLWKGVIWLLVIALVLPAIWALLAVLQVPPN